MRTDILKRHIRIHKDIVDMTDEEAREELRERQKLYEQRTERVKKIIQISREENIPIERCRDLMTLGLPLESKKDTRVQCSRCKKILSCRQSLWRHRKKCRSPSTQRLHCDADIQASSSSGTHAAGQKRSLDSPLLLLGGTKSITHS